MMLAPLLVMLSLLASDAPSATPSATCHAALAAQDEVIALLTGQNGELKGALAERKGEVEALKTVAALLRAQAEAWEKMYRAEVEASDRDRRRAVWAERWKALQYGAVGLAAGVLAERIVE